MSGFPLIFFAMTEHDETIQCEEEGNTLLISLNNPPVNALSSGVLKALDSSLDYFLNNRYLKAAILTGAIDAVFSAGADIREIKDSSVDELYAIMTRAQHIFSRIEKASKIIIAAVNGICFGGGNELAMACDIRVASDDARFGQPEITLGLMPGWGGTQRLPRIVGKTAAMELLLTGKTISAQQAYHMGLINKVTPKNELLNEVQKIAEFFAAAPAASIQAAKKAVVQGLYMPIEEGLRLETHLFMQVAQTDDAREGINAFLQKRQPKFTGQ